MLLFQHRLPLREPPNHRGLRGLKRRLLRGPADAHDRAFASQNTMARPWARASAWVYATPSTLSPRASSKVMVPPLLPSCAPRPESRRGLSTRPLATCSPSAANPCCSVRTGRACGPRPLDAPARRGSRAAPGETARRGLPAQAAAVPHPTAPPPRPPCAPEVPGRRPRSANQELGLAQRHHDYGKAQPAQASTNPRLAVASRSP